MTRHSIDLRWLRDTPADWLWRLQRRTISMQKCDGQPPKRDKGLPRPMVTWSAIGTAQNRNTDGRTRRHLGSSTNAIGLTRGSRTSPASRFLIDVRWSRLRACEEKRRLGTEPLNRVPLSSSVKRTSTHRSRAKISGKRFFPAGCFRESPFAECVLRSPEL